jgi:glycosyltransferase involved in cell wall biosynthesis
VAIVSPFDGSSEVAVTTRALMRAFEGGDLQVSVLTDAYGLRAGADPAGVERIHSGRADAFVSAAIERGADVVHLALEPAHSIHPPVVQRLIDGLCAAGIPAYATIHGPFVPGAAALSPLAETAPWLARCEAVFTHSRGDTECLHGIGISDCQTLPLGVPSMPYYDHAALAHDLGVAGRRVVAFLGRPVQAGGLRETIEAMLLLESRYPDLLLLAITPQWGESDWYLQSCRDQLARADLSRSVFLFDRPMGDAVTAMLLGAAEIVLVPAVDAGGHAPVSVRLPLAAGRATVASRWLIPDGVEDAVCALPALTPQHIARAIEDLLAQGVRRADHEAAARRIAREQSWECVASAYRSVFDRRRQRATTKVVAVEARGRLFETRKRLHGGTDDDAVSPAELTVVRPVGAKLRPV